jgi:hypothetical protein
VAVAQAWENCLKMTDASGCCSAMKKGNRNSWLDLLESEHDNLRAALQCSLDIGEHPPRQTDRCGPLDSLLVAARSR